MKHYYFVTGTDTGVGKTFVSCALLAKANSEGLKTLALKPVAAGSDIVNGEACNEDAVMLREAMSMSLPYAQVNPVLLKAPTSPHIAASEEGKMLSIDRLLGFCRGALLNRPDFALIEGAGGWRVPVNSRETLADLAKGLGYPVILVVGLRLGCINHALLTAEAIRRDGLEIAGWVANFPSADSMSYEEQYLATLKAGLGAPFLGKVDYQSERDIDRAFRDLSLEALVHSN